MSGEPLPHIMVVDGQRGRHLIFTFPEFKDAVHGLDPGASVLRVMEEVADAEVGRPRTTIFGRDHATVFSGLGVSR